MHQICDWPEYHKFTFYVVTFEPMKMRTLSAPQNNRLNLIFVKDIDISVHILIGPKNYDLKCKFTIFSPVANLMHHPLHYFKKRKFYTGIPDAYILPYFEKKEMNGCGMLLTSALLMVIIKHNRVRTLLKSITVCTPL